MKKLLIAASLLALLASGAALAADDTAAGKCMTCHKEKSLGLYNQWYDSEHAKHNVTCIDCHAAAQGDADGFMHEGALIATLVTPYDCGKCHEKEAKEVGDSYHAHAGEILDSKDAYLAHAAGGAPVAIAGCESCHGGKMLIDPNSPNKLHRLSWPNSGIGRLNPDGSKGACTACHTRHAFSVKQARQPEACSKCHLGPDHPQKEVYEESKHGNAYYTNQEKMNLEAKRWIVGLDYFEAPTCATCHMSATSNQAVTHDVGMRISWTLRPPVSKTKDNWEAKRDNMKDVCTNCHGKTFVDGHYAQLDGLVHLYNEKFAKPGAALHKLAKEKKLGDGTANFSNKYEWIWWEIWHHEGRRARHGAAMMGPDYTWWHGIYEVAQHFYFKYIPELRKFHDPDVDKLIDEILADPMHVWMSQPTADIKADIKSGKLAAMFDGTYQVNIK
ncbi:MAG: hypothetical protein GY838_08060 [bacterium]|nr:hypothetical protein [bacterium]